MYNPERTITVKGAIENCGRAEEEVMKKIREAYESDVAAMNVSDGRCNSLPKDLGGLFPSLNFILKQKPAEMWETVTVARTVLGFLLEL